MVGGGLGREFRGALYVATGPRRASGGSLFTSGCAHPERHEILRRRTPPPGETWWIPPPRHLRPPPRLMVDPAATTSTAAPGCRLRRGGLRSGRRRRVGRWRCCLGLEGYRNYSLFGSRRSEGLGDYIRCVWTRWCSTTPIDGRGGGAVSDTPTPLCLLVDPASPGPAAGCLHSPGYC